LEVILELTSYYWLTFPDGECLIGEAIGEGMFQTKVGLINVMSEVGLDIVFTGPLAPPKLIDLYKKEA